MFCLWLFCTFCISLKLWCVLCSLWSFLGTKPPSVTLYSLCKLSSYFNLWSCLWQEHWCSVYTCYAFSSTMWMVVNFDAHLSCVVGSLFWAAVHFALHVSACRSLRCLLQCSTYLPLLASRQSLLRVPKLSQLSEDVVQDMKWPRPNVTPPTNCVHLCERLLEIGDDKF